MMTMKCFLCFEKNRFSILFYFQRMAYDGIGATGTMLDSLHLQLRDAELRRADAERAHQV